MGKVLGSRTKIKTNLGWTEINIAALSKLFTSRQYFIDFFLITHIILKGILTPKLVSPNLPPPPISNLTLAKNVTPCPKERVWGGIHESCTLTLIMWYFLLNVVSKKEEYVVN